MNDLSRRRAAAEAAGDDAALLALREAEVEDRALPEVVDGARRGRALDADPLATTWRAWEVATGQPLLLRLVRLRWREDPVMLRRLARGATATPAEPGLVRPTWHPDGDWPHLRVVLPGPLLEDLVLDGEPDPDPVEVARVLGGGLRAAAALAATGRPNVAAAAHHLVYGPEGVVVPWLDPFGAEPPPSALLAAATAPGRALDPRATTPAAEALQGLVDPAAGVTVAEATAWLQRALADHLLAARHDLVRQARRTAETSRATRLGRLVRRLARALPPPPVHACLRAGHDATLVVAWSDGRTVRGGGAAGTTPRFLPEVWSPEAGLDPLGARQLLRAWGQRASGDTARQAAVNAELGPPAAGAGALVRWLAGQSRLRRADRLLRAWASGVS